MIHHTKHKEETTTCEMRLYANDTYIQHSKDWTEVTCEVCLKSTPTPPCCPACKESWAWMDFDGAVEVGCLCGASFDLRSTARGVGAVPQAATVIRLLRQATEAENAKKVMHYYNESLESTNCVENSPNADTTTRWADVTCGSCRSRRDGIHVDAVTAAPEKVDHPAHYGGGDNPYEAIKIIEAMQPGSVDFHLGNVVKYFMRAGKKGSRVEDLTKARWYLDRAIGILEDTK